MTRNVIETDKHRIEIHISESAGPSVSVDGRSWGPVGEQKGVDLGSGDDVTVIERYVRSGSEWVMVSMEPLLTEAPLAEAIAATPVTEVTDAMMDSAQRSVAMSMGASPRLAAKERDESRLAEALAADPLLGPIRTITREQALAMYPEPDPDAPFRVEVLGVLDPITGERVPVDSIKPIDEAAELTALARAYPATQKSEVALKFIARGNLDAARAVLENGP